MDVSKEFARLNRQLEADLDKRYWQAISRIDGQSPEALEREAKAIKAAKAAEASRRQWEAIGASYRRLRDQIVSAAESFGRGWDSAGRR